MKQFFVAVLAVFLGLSPVCGRLGDNDDKIEDSYGNLVERHLLDDGTVSILYRKDRYLYFVIFDKGVSVLERFSRVDRVDLSEKGNRKIPKGECRARDVEARRYLEGT